MCLGDTGTLVDSFVRTCIPSTEMLGETHFQYQHKASAMFLAELH